MGLTLGGIAGATAWLAARIAPHPLVVGLAFGLSIALTGALHVDGFLDTSDAVFAPVSLERRREILKDPRHGTFAVAAFAVAAVFWLAALDVLPVALLAPACALAAGGSRLAALVAARERRPPLAIAGFNAGLVAALALVLAPAAALVVAAAVVLAVLLTQALRRALGALNGDTYGCTIVVCEVAALIGLTFVLPS